MGKKSKSKLIFKFKEMDAIEPTTNDAYGSLLKKLAEIKTFASGILVPKDFIWPIDKARYLQPHTNLVPDAHKEGLEVHAYGFANDFPLSFNYSFDPVKEYLQFIDNSEFSVDGVVSDFPSTASESIACLAHNKNASRKLKTLIISHNGASGDYPGSTDLAYQKAIDDGVDLIDCSIQLSQDGVAFCMASADLTGTTSAAVMFPDRSADVPEIQENGGIFSFDLSWTEIQSLKPELRSPFDKDLSRNPINKNKGKILSLPDFLELTKKNTNVGILINIENAAFLAEKKGLDIVKAVTTALSDAGLDKQSTQKVMIQSDDSSVLQVFKNVSTYERVYIIDKELGGVSPDVPLEIKKFADAVSLQKRAVILNYPDPIFLTKNFSNLVLAMKAANISVYVGILRNEFQAFLFDLFADPYVELATYNEAKVDGVITEFPATAAAYMSSECAHLKQNLPYTIFPVKPGDLYKQVHEADPEGTQSTAAPSPEPIINAKDVVDPPLPPVAKNLTTTSSPPESDAVPSSPASPPASAPSAARKLGHGVFISALLGLLLSMFMYSKNVSIVY